MYFDIVPHVVASVEWTTPVLLSGYQATGSWKGVVLQLICIVIGVFVYRPFIRMFEMQRRQQMIQNVNQLVEEYKSRKKVEFCSHLQNGKMYVEIRHGCWPAN